MPIWDAPPRRLVTLIQRLARDRREHAPAQDDVSRERVQAVLPGDAAVVRDRVVPVSGQARLRAGEEVHVWNRAGQPVLILAHAARRAQFPQVPQPALGQVVEELFLSGNRSTGVFDVYFRNFDQVTKLGISAHVGATNPPNSVPLSPMGWGLGTNRFFVSGGGAPLGQLSSVLRVFKLNRTANQSYQPGQKAKATLEATLDLATVPGVALAQVQVTVPASISLRSVPPPPAFDVPFTTPFAFQRFLHFVDPPEVGLPGPPGFWNATQNEPNVAFTELLAQTLSGQTLLDDRRHVVQVRSLRLDYFGGSRNGQYVVDLSDGQVLLDKTLRSFVATQPLLRLVRVFTMKAGIITGHALGDNNGLAAAVRVEYVTPSETFLLLGEPGVATHQVLFQANSRHLLWAVASQAKPFGVPAQVFLQSLPVASTPPMAAGPITQIGTTLGKFFFQFGTTYGRPLELLQPFDLLWATVTLGPGSQPLIEKELLHPVSAWKTSEPSVITLQETDPKFPVKDATLVPITGLKKLPAGVVIFGGTVTPAVQVFQAINDAELLASVGRKKTS